MWLALIVSSFVLGVLVIVGVAAYLIEKNLERQEAAEVISEEEPLEISRQEGSVRDHCTLDVEKGGVRTR